MGRIRLENITKRFGHVVAVQSFSLDIREGEFVALIGESGCGKTTTLRILAGFEEPDEGVVSIDDRVMNGVPPQKRNIGMVFQSYALFPNMTVWQNVAFGLVVSGTPRDVIRRRVAELLATVGLEGYGDRYPGQLSGGQQQRVALARALARDPGILLLDEPLSALDAKIRVRLRGELKKLQQRLGITTVYVTHDQEEAMALADRIVVMHRGVAVQVGTPVELYHSPGNTFVADFIGTVNLLPARVGATGRLEWAGGSLSARAARSLAPGEPVQVAVRPEKIRVLGPASAGGEVTRGPAAVGAAVDSAAVGTAAPGPDPAPDRGPDPGVNVWRGQVTLVTFLGSFVRLNVEVAGAELLVDVTGVRHVPFAVGDEVHLTCEPDDCVVLQAAA